MMVVSNGFFVVELSSGRKIAIRDGKQVKFFHGTTALLTVLDELGDGKIRAVINIEHVAVIRRPEEHEIEWCEHFTF